jgi:hypothetical protein
MKQLQGPKHENRHQSLYNEPLELTAPQHTAVKGKRDPANAVVAVVVVVVKSTTPAFAAGSLFFEQRAPVWPLSLAAELLALSNHFFARSATGCLSDVQTRTPVSTTPLKGEERPFLDGLGSRPALVILYYVKPNPLFQTPSTTAAANFFFTLRASD